MGRVMAEDAFEAVVGAHHAEIRRYLLRVTARASDADDLSQETFLRAFRAYRALPPGSKTDRPARPSGRTASTSSLVFPAMAISKS